MMLHRFFHSADILLIPTKVSPYVLPRPEMHAPVKPAVPDSMTVEVEYGKKCALLRALKKGHFAKRQINVRLDLIPVGGCGKVLRKVKEWEFDRSVSVHNALHVIVMTHRIAFADVLTALAVARDFPRRHQFHELVTFFHSGHGRMCHLVIRDDEGAREIEIDHVAMNHRYDLGAHFLTIVPGHPRF